ncbi:MAG TPA: hypothetical protein DCZ93_11380 [Elusimicrobia bacterium]|nr:hypothetical protein [Elusimicrobiota bacterium]
MLPSAACWTKRLPAATRRKTYTPGDSLALVRNPSAFLKCNILSHPNYCLIDPPIKTKPPGCFSGGKMLLTLVFLFRDVVGKVPGV